MKKKVPEKIATRKNCYQKKLYRIFKYTFNSFFMKKVTSHFLGNIFFSVVRFVTGDGTCRV